MKSVIPQVALENYTFSTIRSMGILNVGWLFLLLFLFIAWRAKKIGVTSIGKNEWGMVEVLGFPLIPMPFGIWLYVKGVFHVKEVSIAPARVDFSLRSEVGRRVLMVVVTAHVTATTKGTGTWRERFIQRRRDLIAALYGAYDETVTDAENPERIDQTRDMLEAGCRQILREGNSIDDLSMESLIETCGTELRERLGEYIMAVYIREDAPVDGQLWKEGRSTFDDELISDELPPGVVRLPSPDTAS